MNHGRKITGGKYHANRKKKSYERKNQDRHVIVDRETRKKTIRVMGGNNKTFILKTNLVNIVISGKAKKAEITNVEATPQNTFLARQNRLMRGSIIDTSLGKARITNRPSQEGMVNAVLIK
jgi:small subunit ribosomal protein S8e